MRLSVVAVNAKTGVLVYDHFNDNTQRMELDTRLRQLAVSQKGELKHSSWQYTYEVSRCLDCEPLVHALLLA